jgi:hypothetical protein
LVAKDGLVVIAGTIENIKAIVSAVKSSPLQWEELMKCASECGLDKSKGISYDVSTRWNSTYLMLRDALYYKSALIRLKQVILVGMFVSIHVLVFIINSQLVKFQFL